jgi:hypothetical protein
MRPRAMLAGTATALLLTMTAGAATAQARYYPDGTNCSLLSDAELVACQNQIYARQLESGISQRMSAPAEVPSSHIGGDAEGGQSDVVPGAEGTPALAPTGLPGPEGTRVYVPTE